jgi:hypothetical protein
MILPSFDISLDWEEFDRKPSTKLQYKDVLDKFGNPRSEVSVIGARLGSDCENLTVVKLARHISRGQTWSPFVFKVCPDWKRRRRLEGLFESCQVMALDFDGGESLEEIQEKAVSLGIKLSLIHTSFSSTPAHPKHRAILILDSPLQDFTQTKKISVGLAKSFESDPMCVDTARLYFGSTPNSVVFINREASNSISTLESLADAVGAENLITKSKLGQEKPDETIWGDHNTQKELFDKIPKKKLDNLKRKIKGLLIEIEQYQPVKNSSRYNCVWRNTSRIARMPEVAGCMAHKWVMEAIASNREFDDWEHDPDQVVISAIEWSATHSDDPA